MARNVTMAIVGAAVLALAGCGSSQGGGTGGGGGTPDFLATAKAICASANAEIASLPRPGPSLASQAQEASIELPIIHTELTELAVLKAPSSERARFAQALSASRRATKLIGELIIAVRAGDRARIAALALAANTSDIQTRTAASALGLTACAKAVEPSGAT
jgi:hypothetical protein